VIDRRWIGCEVGSSTLAIERGRLRFFAQATGETDPIYSDLEAARAAGYADIPAPPTFLFAANLESGLTFRMLEEMAIPLSSILHGEQRFRYFAPVVAGDEITATSRITDIYEKRGGALEFIDLETTAVNQAGETVAAFGSVIVVRN
jgi:acyl dehydratase